MPLLIQLITQLFVCHLIMHDGELFPVRCLAGADGIVGVAHLEGVGGGGEVTVPERVGVGDFHGAAGEGKNQGDCSGNGFHLHAGRIIRKVPREIEGDSRIAGGSMLASRDCPPEEQTLTKDVSLCHDYIQASAKFSVQICMGIIWSDAVLTSKSSNLLVRLGKTHLVSKSPKIAGGR